MEIKSRYKTPNPHRLFSKLKRRSKFVFLMLAFPTIAALAFIIGVYSYKTGFVNQTIQSVRKIVLVRNYYSGIKTRPEKLLIDIKFKNLQKLINDKKNAKEIGFLSTLNADETYVPITITHGNKTVNAKARIKGNSDAKFSDKWSLRIKVRGDQTIMGVKVFSIHDPGIKNYMAEWLFHQLLDYNNLISLRYKFVEVSINGENDGIYAFEENFEKRLIENNSLREGIILRFDEYWNYYWYYTQRFDNWHEYLDRFYSMAPIDAFETTRIKQDSNLTYQFLKAKDLLESYRQGKLPVGKVFDINKIAKIFALADLLGEYHSLETNNIRFYYNPITSLIEPIGYDQHFEVAPIDKLIGEGKQFNSGNDNPMRLIWEDSFFRDTLFFKLYIQSLYEISKPDYLAGFLNEIDKEYNKNIKLLYRNDIGFKDQSLNILKYNQGYIQRILNPIRGLEVYYSNLDNDSITIQVGSFHPFPIKVKSISLNGKRLEYKDIEGCILDPKTDFKLMKFKSFRIKIDTGLVSLETLDSLKVNCALLGLDERISESTRHNNFYDETFLSNDFIRIDPNINKFEFFKIDEEKKIIQIKTGSYKIIESIIIPHGYQVICQPGVKMDLINSSLIISYSPFQFLGLSTDPIIVHSSDSSGQGIVIINSKESSFFENVQFENLSNSSKNGWELTGALNFYESSVSFKSCIFSNNLTGDDFLNIVRSDFKIEKCTFSKCYADAFDSDFSVGYISNTKFLNSGNDALDISGSQVKISDIFIRNTGDKGLSVGERSILSGSNIEISNSDKAIVSKDYSEITLNHVYIEDCNIGFVAFRKKPEFGPARINLTDSYLTNVKTPFLIEVGSKVIQDGIIITADQKNLKETLYKVKEE